MGSFLFLESPEIISTGLDAIDFVFGLLKCFENFLPFIVPGFITLFVYTKIYGKEINETKGTVIKAVFISCFYKMILDVFSLGDAIYISLLFVISAASPFILIWIRKWSFIDSIINTTRKVSEVIPNANPLEILLNEQKMIDPEKNYLAVMVYMDKYGIAYHGALANIPINTQEPKYIILQSYRIQKLNKETNKYVWIESSHHSPCHKVVVYMNEVSRIETEILPKKR